MPGKEHPGSFLSSNFFVFLRSKYKFTCILKIFYVNLYQKVVLIYLNIFKIIVTSKVFSLVKQSLFFIKLIFLCFIKR